MSELRTDARGPATSDRSTGAAMDLPQRLARVALALGGLSLVGWLFGTYFATGTTYGLKDWDVSSVFRFTPLLHLLKYHEGPWWNPWMCGGLPDWGYVEGATNVVSPYLPAYLAFPLPVAERIEVIGSTGVALLSTWLLAGRATSLASIRFGCALVYALNGRWAMQATVGHTWHLQYAWAPLILYFFIRSVEERRWTWAAWGGAILALTVYQGGIYPLPHTALLVGAFGVTYALVLRSYRPIVFGAVVGVVAGGLSAPKLFPVLSTMHRLPREIDSIESMRFSDLVAALVTPGQTINQGPVEIPPYHWHEYGTYVGWPVVIALGLFFLFARGRLENGVRIVGALFFALSLGAFAWYAPWPVLHTLPIFSSQHVPSRFSQSALLVTAFGFCLLAERWSRRVGERRAWLDLGLVLPVLLIGADLVSNQKLSLDHTFKLVAPEVSAEATFHHQEKSISRYTTLARGSMVLATYANTGVLDCYGYPTPPRQYGMGAIATDSPHYLGEAYLEDANGNPLAARSQVSAWTPNSATVDLSEPHPGDRLVYNMSADPGWSANGRPAIESGGRVAALLAPSEIQVRFSYLPPGFELGMVVALLTLVGLEGARRRFPVPREAAT